MTKPKTDVEAWERYPMKRDFFNKLWFALKMGYVCGPVGIPIPKDGEYVVRPTYNVHGLGIGARVVELKKGDYVVGDIGHFWCEYFEGEQYTADFIWNGWSWDQTHTFIGYKPKTNLTKFEGWVKTDKKLPIPKICIDYLGAIDFNVEYIGDKPIEVHLRTNPDPVVYNEMIPVWGAPPTNKDIAHFQFLGYSFKESFDHAFGFLNEPRYGFWVK